MSAEPSRRPVPTLRVRTMIHEDLEQVVETEREIYAHPWTRGNFADSLQSGYDAWMFEDGRRMTGYAIAMWAADELHLLNISVAARLQGRGFGRAMLRWLCDDAARRGAASMLLEVRPSNARARALYASDGFAQIGLRKRYYPDGLTSREDALVLRRMLVPAGGEADR